MISVFRRPLSSIASASFLARAAAAKDPTVLLGKFTSAGRFDEVLSNNLETTKIGRDGVECTLTVEPALCNSMCALDRTAGPWSAVECLRPSHRRLRHAARWRDCYACRCCRHAGSARARPNASRRVSGDEPELLRGGQGGHAPTPRRPRLAPRPYPRIHRGHHTGGARGWHAWEARGCRTAHESLPTEPAAVLIRRL